MKRNAASRPPWRGRMMSAARRICRRAFRRLPFGKISWKLTLIYAGVFSVVLILLNACTLYGVRYLLVQQAKSQVKSSASITMANIARTLHGAAGAGTLTDPALLSEAAQNSSLNVRIVGTDGETVLSSGRFRLETIRADAGIGTPQAVESHGRHLVVLNEKILAEKSAFGYLQVAYEMHREYVFLKLLFGLLAAADLCGMALSVLAGFLMSRRVLRPVDRMTRAAQQISIGGLDRRIEVGPANDELTRLAVTFNQMIERLQTAFEKQSRFVSDASHELRTPIAVIRGYADVMDHWGKDDPQVLAESIGAIRRETEGMTTLVERLLFLARGDSGRVRLVRETFDVKKLLGEVVEESRLLHTGLTLRFTAPEGLALCADRRLVKQALRALVDNSLQYTPPDGRIDLTAACGPDTVQMTVRDTGIGIPPENIPNIFDRFYRVDRARTREKAGGSGLGLSIVQWIAQVHGGSVHVESTPGRGTSVTLYFPLAG